MYSQDVVGRRERTVSTGVGDASEVGVRSLERMSKRRRRKYLTGERRKTEENKGRDLRG
jgi:hypothetical protein